MARTKPGPARPAARKRSSARRAFLLGALLLAIGVVVVIGVIGRQGLLHHARLPHPGSAAGYNVLLVTLDTVRRDHLGCYGDASAVTPNIDRLAAEGIRFDNAVTSVPLTRTRARDPS